MKIAVLNGSPKGMVSVTVQYVRFLQKKFPQHEFTIVHACHDIKRLEEDRTAMDAAVETVRAADAVLWATPVYVLLVPGAYKRFVELMFERSAQSAFQDKYAAVLTTSVRFFDHTAINYLNAISDDLDMHFVGAYSAEMYDLVKEDERQRLLAFWTAFLQSVEQRAPTPRNHSPVRKSDFVYTPSQSQTTAPTAGRKTIVLTDSVAGSNLDRMVSKLCSCLQGPVEVVNLNEIKIQGGCMGCIQCGQENLCVYRDTDDVADVYRKLMAADIVIEAATVKDRFVTSRWKLFQDRGFFNNHVPTIAGKQVAYLVSGPLRQIPNLRQIIEASADMQRANLVGIVTDECDDSRELDCLLEQLALRIADCVRSGYIHPTTFLGKAGRKVLRDEIWASLRFVFPGDHRYYKRHGLYDFPKRSLKTRLGEMLVRLLLRIPAYRKEFPRRIKAEMIKPLEAVIEQEDRMTKSE